MDKSKSIPARDETIAGIEAALRDVASEAGIEPRELSIEIGIAGVWTARRIARPVRTFTFDASITSARDALRVAVGLQAFASTVQKVVPRTLAESDHSRFGRRA